MLKQRSPSNQKSTHNLQSLGEQIEKILKSNEPSNLKECQTQNTRFQMFIQNMNIKLTQHLAQDKRKIISKFNISSVEKPQNFQKVFEQTYKNGQEKLKLQLQNEEIERLNKKREKLQDPNYIRQIEEQIKQKQQEEHNLNRELNQLSTEVNKKEFQLSQIINDESLNEQKMSQIYVEKKRVKDKQNIILSELIISDNKIDDLNQKILKNQQELKMLQENQSPQDETIVKEQIGYDAKQAQRLNQLIDQHSKIIDNFKRQINLMKKNKQVLDHENEELDLEIIQLTQSYDQLRLIDHKSPQQGLLNYLDQIRINSRSNNDPVTMRVYDVILNSIEGNYVLQPLLNKQQNFLLIRDSPKQQNSGKPNFRIKKLEKSPSNFNQQDDSLQNFPTTQETIRKKTQPLQNFNTKTERLQKHEYSYDSNLSPKKKQQIKLLQQTQIKILSPKQSQDQFLQKQKQIEYTRTQSRNKSSINLKIQNELINQKKEQLILQMQENQEKLQQSNNKQQNEIQSKDDDKINSLEQQNDQQEKTLINQSDDDPIQTNRSFSIQKNENEQLQQENYNEDKNNQNDGIDYNDDEFEHEYQDNIRDDENGQNEPITIKLKNKNLEL